MSQIGTLVAQGGYRWDSRSRYGSFGLTKGLRMFMWHPNVTATAEKQACILAIVCSLNQLILSEVLLERILLLKVARLIRSVVKNVISSLCCDLKTCAITESRWLELDVEATSYCTHEKERGDVSHNTLQKCIGSIRFEHKIQFKNIEVVE